MLDKMRGISRPVIWIVAIVFIAGMGTMGISNIFKEKPHVGRIAGKIIRYDEYYKMVQNSYSDYIENSEDKEIDEKTIRQLNDKTWDQLVQTIILDKAIKKYDIKVSPKEVANKMLNDPPDIILQHENFQTDGKFDRDKYITVLKNPDIDWTWLENYYTQVLLYKKLSNIINSDVIITNYEVKKDYLEKNTKAQADIIVFSVDMVDSVEVTDKEIHDYYNKFKEDFKKEPQRKLMYVKIPLEPGPVDIKEAEDKINNIYKMVMDGEDFAELAKDYSECPSASKGGDLDFFGKGRMDPTFEEKAFSMKKGEVSEPIKTRFGWHIIKLTDTRITDGKKEVRASHILIKEEPGADTRRNHETIASDFYEQCQIDSFKIVAKNFNYEVQETEEFKEDSGYLPGIGKAKTLIDFAFENDLYEISKPYLSESNDFYITMISYKIGEHYDELDVVKDKIISDIELRKQMDILAIKADSITSHITSDNFMEVAKNDSLKIVDSKLISIKSYIRDIGREEKLNQAILDLKEVGKISSLIKGKKAYYIAKLVEFQPADMKKFEAEKDQLKEQFITQKENQNYSEWYNQAKEEAHIKDWRSKFFRM